MKNKFIQIWVLLFVSISANAQIDSAQVEKRFSQLEQQIQELKEDYEATQNELQKLRLQDNSIQRSVNGLSNKSEKLSSQIDSLQDLLQTNSNKVNNLDQQISEQKEELRGQISDTREMTNKSVSELDNALSRNTLYWIIAVLALGLLSFFAFYFLKRKVSANQSSVYETLNSTRRELEQEAIRLDEKLIGVMESQMKIIQEDTKAQPESEENEQDHSLALKMADEIVRIEKNISRMDEGTKGLKQLSKAVERIKDNFASNGYEMVNMVGKSFDERMKASIVNTVPDDNLKDGEQIISRIIKPQINYKGVMIQAAQVEVAVG